MHFRDKMGKEWPRSEGQTWFKSRNCHPDWSWEQNEKERSAKSKPPLRLLEKWLGLIRDQHASEAPAHLQQNFEWHAVGRSRDGTLHYLIVNAHCFLF